jgi:hypothetical protein
MTDDKDGWGQPLSADVNDGPDANPQEKEEGRVPASEQTTDGPGLRGAALSEDEKAGEETEQQGGGSASGESAPTDLPEQSKADYPLLEEIVWLENMGMQYATHVALDPFINYALKHKYNDLGDLLYMPPGIEGEERYLRIVSAIHFIAKEGPRDQIERMLLTQIVSVEAGIKELSALKWQSSTDSADRMRFLERRIKMTSKLHQQLDALVVRLGKHRRRQ